MRFLLDTNVISDARRPSAIAVSGWLKTQEPHDLAISAISLVELEYGVLRAECRDPPAGVRLRKWIDGQVRPSFAGRVLSVDESVALRAARLHVPDPAPEMDALIAATALVHDLTLVTRNVRDFQRTGVRLLNPWDL